MNILEFNMDENQDRLWSSLESISNRLWNIEEKLSDVIRLEEKVNTHDQALSRYGNRLDSHDMRIRDSELWQAHQGDKSSLERQITNVSNDLKSSVNNVESQIDNVKKEVSGLKNNSSVNKGQKDVVKEVLKYLTGILAALLIYKMTRGS